MSSPTSDTTRSRLARRVRWLYAVHGVLILLCFVRGPLDGRTLDSAVWLGIFLAETCLLALFAALVPSAMKRRWISAAAACFWSLDTTNQLFPRSGGWEAFLILIVFAVVFGSGLYLRWRGQGLYHYAIDQPPPANESWHFTIRQVLIGTIVMVAGSAAIFAFQATFPENEALITALFMTFVLGAPFLTLWSALGRGDPRLRGVLVVAALAGGVLLPMDALSGREPWWYYPVALSMQTGTMLETFWVVRSCRYRLGPTPAAPTVPSSRHTPASPLVAPWMRARAFLQPKLAFFQWMPRPLWLLLALFIGIDKHLARQLFAYDGDLVFNTFVVLPIAQAGVLAIMCVLANVRWLYRIALAGAGMMALLRLVHRTLEDMYVVPFIAIASTVVFVVMFATCTVIRRRGFSLQRFGPTTPPPPREPFRFSIAQLIALTSLVALLIATLHWVEQIEEPNVLLMVTILSQNFLPGALLALWAALDPNHLVVRCVLALVLGTAPAILPDLYLDLSNEPWGLWIWPFMTGLNTSLTLASLLVVRSCGYRLVRRAPADSASGPNFVPAAHHAQVRS